MGLEPTTFCMASRRSSQLSYTRVGEGTLQNGGRPLNTPGPTTDLPDPLGRGGGTMAQAVDLMYEHHDHRTDRGPDRE